MRGKLKQKRKKTIKERKNILPAFFAMLSLWSILFFIVYMLDPSNPFILVLFFVTLFPACFVTFSLIFAEKTRSFLITSGISVFLLLRLFSLGNIINLFLLSGLVVSLDLYIKSKRKY